MAIRITEELARQIPMLANLLRTGSCKAVDDGVLITSPYKESDLRMLMPYGSFLSRPDGKAGRRGAFFVPAGNPEAEVHRLLGIRKALARPSRAFRGEGAHGVETCSYLRVFRAFPATTYEGPPNGLTLWHLECCEWPVRFELNGEKYEEDDPSVLVRLMSAWDTSDGRRIRAALDRGGNLYRQFRARIAAVSERSQLSQERLPSRIPGFEELARQATSEWRRRRD